MGLKAASAEFPQFKHLEGCLIVVQGLELGTAPSTVRGAAPDATYEYIVGTVAVLDGTPDAEHIDGKPPIVLEDFRLSGGALVPQLKNAVGKYDSDGTPKLRFGRVVRFKNSFGNDSSFKLGDPSDADAALAAEYVNSEAGAETFPEKDPFAADTKAAKAFA